MRRTHPTAAAVFALIGLVAAGCAWSATEPFCTPGTANGLPNPILFVTQVPIPDDFATIGSVFANHRAGLGEVGRGGDLYVLYPDGTRCNLTREGGFGMAGMQADDAIAVRDPAVSFDGTKAIFSMVVGAAGSQFEVNDYYWQLYEITGLAQGEAVTITPVANQPADFNNIMPTYAPDGSIIFVSDRPRNGQRHLYPQLDEYESTPTPTGLWKLSPSGDLTLLGHSPSGSFDPFVDSYGRVIFTRWDHLQRDQQADADDAAPGTFDTFDFADESAGAATTSNRVEVFPEPRNQRDDLLTEREQGHNINHFFPWEVNQDGTEEETLNHIGRHELHDYFDRAFNDDGNLQEFIDEVSGRTNPNSAFNTLQIAEDPTTPGRYYATEAPEFQTHAAGQIFVINAPLGMSADDIVVDYITHPATGTVVDDNATPPADHSGHYREPLPLSDGNVLVVHTAETREANNDGTRANPDPRYDFQLKLLGDAGNGFMAAGASLTGGINATVSYFDPDVLVSYSGPMWELNPVEVRLRSVPPVRTERALAAPEQAVFDDAVVDPEAFRQYLRDNNLAVMVARNVTSRDDADEQQPYNLQVPGGVVSNATGGIVYDVTDMQYVQGDQVRGIGGLGASAGGRRVLARFLHDPNVVAANPENPGGPVGSVPVFADGSVAAFMPVRRAMAWQLTAPDETPVVRERFWITFQPGEIRVCDGCHGVNDVNHLGEGPAQNESQALAALLQHWKENLNTVLFRNGFEALPVE